MTVTIWPLWRLILFPYTICWLVFVITTRYYDHVTIDIMTMYFYYNHIPILWPEAYITITTTIDILLHLLPYTITKVFNVHSDYLVNLCYNHIRILLITIRYNFCYNHIMFTIYIYDYHRLFTYISLVSCQYTLIIIDHMAIAYSDHIVSVL